MWFVKDLCGVLSGLFHQYHVLELEGMLRAVLGGSLTLGRGCLLGLYFGCLERECCFLVAERVEMGEVRDEVDSGQDYGVHVSWVGSMRGRHLSLMQK